MTELRFGDRVVVVTGAGRGVGRSQALHLVAKGARVVIADYGVGIDGGGSSPAPAEDVVEKSKSHGGCPLNGEVLQIGVGSVARIAVVRTQGISKTPLTAEDVAEHLDDIMEVNDAHQTKTTGISQ
jgi:NAD(P)-dependent dehydrogenase (short-subunit alcohol dehydrogenase family)